MRNYNGIIRFRWRKNLVVMGSLRFITPCNKNRKPDTFVSGFLFLCGQGESKSRITRSFSSLRSKKLKRSRPRRATSQSLGKACTQFDPPEASLPLSSRRFKQKTILGRMALCWSVRAGRIELPSRPWQGRILPLNHARKLNMTILADY
jgi:hypothetical protein